MKKTRKTYTEEFRTSSVQLALNSEQSIYKTAQDLGITDTTLSTWIKRYKDKNNTKTPASKESFEEENKRLRKENQLLKQERDILKKATAYFAKETL